MALFPQSMFGRLKSHMIMMFCVFIFSRGKVRRYPDFVFGTEKLDVVDEYAYLGVKFNYNGNYRKMIAKQITQARKALYCMLTKARKLQLPIDIQCQLFDHLVLPILLYPLGSNCPHTWTCNIYFLFW